MINKRHPFSHSNIFWAIFNHSFMRVAILNVFKLQSFFMVRKLLPHELYDPTFYLWSFLKLLLFLTMRSQTDEIFTNRNISISRAIRCKVALQYEFIYHYALIHCFPFIFSNICLMQSRERHFCPNSPTNSS